MGPTVWELDGPIPILNRSKTLIMTVPTPRTIVDGTALCHPFGKGSPRQVSE